MYHNNVEILNKCRIFLGKHEIILVGIISYYI